jgi:carbon-monoxide dehydrogenase medium subunit
MPALAFLRPQTVDEAVAALAGYDGEAKVLAGSTALSIMLRQQLVAPAALVSLDRIDSLRGITEADGALLLGSLTTHREVERSALVRERLPVLADTFGKVANVRVRNAATVGGVVAEADYASGPPAVLLALDAVVEVQGSGGSRSEPLADFIVGFYETTLEPDEVVTAVRVPLLPSGTAAVYEKFVTRSSEDRPCVGVAVVLGLNADGSCSDLRVAVGAACESPQRVAEAEALAVGKGIDEALAREIAERYAAEIETLDDMRGSSWYRTEMIKVWVRRTILRAHGELTSSSNGTGPRA